MKGPRLTFCVGVVIGMVGLCANADETMTQDFTPAACLMRGMEVADGKARLCDRAFQPGDSGSIWIEAEEANKLIPHEQCIREEKDRSGGKCVFDVSQASHVVSVPQKGKYTFWARVYWNDAASNSNFISLDGAPPTVLGNSEGPEGYNRWQWIKGPTCELDAGGHNIVVSRREKNVLLDCFMLAPEGIEPKEETRGRSALAPCTTGMIETWDFTPPAVVAWDRLSIIGAERREQIVVQCSVDHGATWQAVPTDGDLHFLKPKGDGTDTIRSRLLFTRKPGEPSPAVENLHLTYRIKDRSLLSIANKHIRLTFAAAAGTLWDLVNAESGVSYMPGHETMNPFLLLALDPKTKKPVPLENVKFLGSKMKGEVGSPALELSYEASGAPDTAAAEGKVFVDCTVALDEGPLSRWRIKVRSECSWPIVEVVFPIVPACLGDPADDVLILPHEQGGERIVGPLLTASLRKCTYPGNGSMQWMDLHDPTCGGIYMASCDKSILQTGVEAEALSRAALKLQMRKFAYVPKGKEWQSSDFVVAAHPGDWHWAADRYREWAETWMEKPQTPKWVSSSDGWLINSINSRFDAALPTAMRTALDYGLTHVESWGQMIPGLPFEHSNCMRFPLPEPLFGTEKDFADAIAQVHAMGGKVGFYVNGWAWNPRYPAVNPRHHGLIPKDVPVPDWEGGFKNFAVQLYDGSYKPWYEKPKNDPSNFPCAFYSMCPSSSGWYNHIKYWIADKYAKEYNSDGMYLDCIARTGTYCFDFTHGHEHHGLCNHAALLRELKAEGIKARGEFFLAMEGCCDVYGQWVDMHLICAAAGLRGWSSGVWPEVYHYTFPDHLLYDGFANGNCGGTDEKILCGVFLLGNRFDGVKGGELCRQVLALRRQIADVLYVSRFMDTVGIDVSDPQIAAKLFVPKSGAQGEALLTVWNPDQRKGGKVTITLPGLDKAKHCYVHPLGESPRHVGFQRENGKLAVDLPEGKLAAIVFTRAPRVSVGVGNPTRTYPGGTSELTIAFANPADESADVGVSFDLPEQWSVTGPKTVPVPGRNEAEQRYVFQSPPTAGMGGVPLVVNVRVGDGVRAEHRLIPVVAEMDLKNLLSNGSFEAAGGWGLGAPKGKGAAEYDGSIAHSGAQSVRLENQDCTQRAAAGQTYRAEGLSGKTFRLTAWCKTKDVSPGDDGKGTVIRIILYKDENTASGPWVFSQPLTGTHDWTKVDVPFTIPDNTHWIGIELYLWKATGTAWWDDVLLEEAPKS